MTPETRRLIDLAASQRLLVSGAGILPGVDHVTLDYPALLREAMSERDALLAACELFDAWETGHAPQQTWESIVDAIRSAVATAGII